MKLRFWPVLMLAVFAMAACARLPDTAASTPTPANLPTSAAASPRPPLDFPDRMVTASSSLSILVDDPVATLAELQARVEEAGGFVSSASSWSDGTTAYASLSARVPPEALADLRKGVIELASSVQNNSTYSQDITAEVQSLQDRLEFIDESEQRLLDVLLGSGDASLAKSFVLIAQLFQQERLNAENQLQSYLESSTLSSFDVTLNGQAPTLRLYPEGTPTPYLE